MLKHFSKNTKILFIVAALTILAPRDLISDSIPILGQIDDLALFILLVCSVYTDFKSLKRDKAIQKNKTNGKGIEKIY
ncbi:YkvA family protein [Bacillus salipaludis]|uniref:YkvA family protein n=1 Tax=Bacillus salipaludis TaxID=2547811 RepID=UPI002E22950E|nr:YkvA family protein [Bacillus salipaludis]